MKSWPKLATVLLVLLSVLTAFALPSVDLEPTALRAARLASLIFAVLALAGTVIMSRSERVLAVFAASQGHRPLPLPSPDVVDLTCTRLC